MVFPVSSPRFRSLVQQSYLSDALGIFHELSDWLTEAAGRAVHGLDRLGHHVGNLLAPRHMFEAAYTYMHSSDSSLRRRRTAHVLVIPLTFALAVVTYSTPAYAVDPKTVGAPAGYLEPSLTTYLQEHSQTITATGIAPTVGRDTITVTAAPAVTTGTYSAGGAAELPSGASASPVVAEALKYLGIPYVANSADPSVGFDCSGLTMYVYGQLGIALPHSAAAQLGMGQVISEAEAQPGDLVHLPGHVGIWVGPGVMIDAPVPGQTVGIHKIWAEPTIFRIAY